MSTTYSFKDTSGALTHPLLPIPFTFAGEIGAGQFVVSMATEKSVQDVASDGVVMISAIAGDNGHLAIEVQQTSNLHKTLLGLYNIVKTLMLQGDVSTWASMAVTLRNSVDGTTHLLTGVSFSKIPDKVYTAQGQRITWTLMAADIQTISL